MWGVTTGNDVAINVENMTKENYDENGKNRDEKELFQEINLKISNNYKTKGKKDKRGKSPSTRTRSKSKEKVSRQKEAVTVTQVT